MNWKFWKSKPVPARPKPRVFFLPEDKTEEVLIHWDEWSLKESRKHQFLFWNKCGKLIPQLVEPGHQFMVKFSGSCVYFEEQFK